MSTDLDQANQYVDKANKKMQGGGCGCMGGSYESKASYAIGLYNKACVIYQREQKYPQAGKCFEEIGSIKERLDEDPFEDYQEAAYCYSFVDKKKTIEINQKCCKNYESKGKFNKAAEVYENMAKYYEEEKDYVNAANLYDKAAKSYSLISSGYKSKEKTCRIKSYDLSVIHDIGEWKEIVEGYSNIGKSYLLEPMLKYNAKDMFFKVVCVYFLHDVSSLSNIIYNRIIYKQMLY